MADGPVRVTKPLLEVLNALLDADDFEMHGWAIMKGTTRTGPTVYKILERLESSGWVTARWEEQAPDSNKPRRRFYRLTPRGTSKARTLLEARAPKTTPRLTVDGYMI
jgi:PadR family transcriptional regulator PadR